MIAAWSWGKIGLVNWVAIGEPLSLVSKARCPSKVVDLYQDNLIVLFVSFVGRPHDGTGYLIVSHAGPKWLYRSLLLLGMHAVLGYRADVNCVQVGSHEFIVFQGRPAVFEAKLKGDFFLLCDAVDYPLCSLAYCVVSLHLWEIGLFSFLLLSRQKMTAAPINWITSYMFRWALLMACENFVYANTTAFLLSLVIRLRLMNINKSRSKIFLNDYIFFLHFDLCRMFYLVMNVLFFPRATWSSAAHLILSNTRQGGCHVNILLWSTVHYPLFLLQ